MHLGDVVGAIGKPTKSRRGEPSLIVDELVLLSRNPLAAPRHASTASPTSSSATAAATSTC